MFTLYINYKVKYKNITLLGCIRMIYKEDIKNIYNINDELLNRLTRTLTNYLEKISEIDFNCLDIYTLANQLDIISELYDYLINPEFWDDKIKVIINRIINEIQNGKVQRISLNKGLTELAFSIYVFNKNTGHCTKLLKSINELIVSEVNLLIEDIGKYKEEINVFMYDSIYGLSGICRYLLMQKKDIYIYNCIKKIIKLFVEWTDYKFYNNYFLPGWYIKPNNMIMLEKKALYPSGFIDYGIAHGMMGPLIIMSLGYKEGIIVEGQKSAINNIIKEYKNCIIYKNNLPFWQGIRSVDDYINNRNRIERDRLGWCYGSISILGGLRIAAKALNDAENIKWTSDNIFNFLNNNVEEYGLETPMICHGLSGILYSLLLEFRANNQEVLKIRSEEILNKLLNMYNYQEDIPYSNIEAINGKKKISKEWNFLMGSSGTILAMCRFISNTEYFEQRLLLK